MKYTIDVFTPDSVYLRDQHGRGHPKNSYKVDTLEEVSKVIQDCSIAGICKVEVWLRESPAVQGRMPQQTMLEKPAAQENWHLCRYCGRPYSEGDILSGIGLLGMRDMCGPCQCSNAKPASYASWTAPSDLALKARDFQQRFGRPSGCLNWSDDAGARWEVSPVVKLYVTYLGEPSFHGPWKHPCPSPEEKSKMEAWTKEALAIAKELGMDKWTP